MALQDLEGALKEFGSSLQQAKAAGVVRVDALPPKTLTTYQQARFSAVCAGVSTSKSKLQRIAQALIDDPLVEHETAVFLKKFVEEIADLEDVKALDLCLDEYADSVIELSQEKKGRHDFSLPNGIPSDIRAEMEADAHEIKSCLKAKCYRSVVILAGRLLETALHRKYFDATGTDLLEKAPGIGLGNLIARLSERNVLLDPALGNQIHLINNVRIFSVHTKKETFFPSEAQAYAIALYTFDVLDKLFKK